MPRFLAAMLCVLLLCLPLVAQAEHLFQGIPFTVSEEEFTRLLSDKAGYVEMEVLPAPLYGMTAYVYPEYYSTTMLHSIDITLSAPHDEEGCAATIHLGHERPPEDWDANKKYVVLAPRKEPASSGVDYDDDAWRYYYEGALDPKERAVIKAFDELIAVANGIVKLVRADLGAPGGGCLVVASDADSGARYNCPLLSSGKLDGKRIRLATLYPDVESTRVSLFFDNAILSLGFSQTLCEPAYPAERALTLTAVLQYFHPDAEPQLPYSFKQCSGAYPLNRTEDYEPSREPEAP